MLYNGVLVSALYQSESAIHIHMYVLNLVYSRQMNFTGLLLSKGIPFLNVKIVMNQMLM